MVFVNNHLAFFCCLARSLRLTRCNGCFWARSSLDRFMADSYPRCTMDSSTLIYAFMALSEPHPPIAFNVAAFAPPLASLLVIVWRSWWVDHLSNPSGLVLWPLRSE